MASSYQDLDTHAKKNHFYLTSRKFRRKFPALAAISPSAGALNDALPLARNAVNPASIKRKIPCKFVKILDSRAITEHDHNILGIQYLADILPKTL